MSDNPFGYQDESAKRLSALWLSLRVTATTEQKDAIGKAFIAHALNLGDKVADAFAQGEWDANRRVGMRQGNAERYTPDFEKFWSKVQETFNNLHTPEDILFLVEKCGMLGPLHFLHHIDSCFGPPCEGMWSGVLRGLVSNAIAYK